MAGRLENKVAVVTGAGSGIGKASALLFAREGAKVVVADCDVKAGEETVKEIDNAGGEAIFVRTDVSNANNVEKMVKDTIVAYGKLGVLFNNAGIFGEAASTTECTEENWDKTMATNLKGVWLAMKFAIPEMLKIGGGSIINMASQAAERGTPNEAAYTASKGGVLALSRATAIECAAKNVRVNCINPGVIATPMVLNMRPEIQNSFVAAIPQDRLGEPEEVAQAALFLASDESSHVTGHALVVDGGLEAYSGLTM